MPQFDLRTEKNALDPIAPFKVLGKMCHPNDSRAYERMLARVQKNTGIGVPRRRPLDIDEFYSEVKRTALKACVAGGVLLTRLQLLHRGYANFTIGTAIPLVRAQILEDQLPGYAIRNQCASTRQSPVSGSKMREAYETFQPVAHLWAALIH